MKRLYEYRNTGNGSILNELTGYNGVAKFYDPDIFLIYAETYSEAMKLAYRHLYDGLPISKFYGTLNGEHHVRSFYCVQ